MPSAGTSRQSPAAGSPHAWVAATSSATTASACPASPGTRPLTAPRQRGDGDEQQPHDPELPARNCRASVRATQGASHGPRPQRPQRPMCEQGRHRRRRGPRCAPRHTSTEREDRCGPGRFSRCWRHWPRCCWYRRWSAQSPAAGRHPAARPADPGAQRPRRRLRHHRAHGGQGDGGRRHHRLGRGVQPARRRAAPSGSAARSTRAATTGSSCPWGWAWSAACSPTARRPRWPTSPRSPGSPQETEIVVVGKDSPLRTMRRPGRGLEGGPGRDPGRRRLLPRRSGPPGPDAHGGGRSGSPRATVNYVAYDGGGELLAAVLGGKVAFGVSGLGEYADQIAAGELRVLAVTGGRAGRRTRRPHAARGRGGRRVHQLAGHRRPARPGRRRPRPSWSARSPRCDDSPEWRDALERNGWDDAFLPRRRVRRLPGQRERAGGRGAARAGAGVVTRTVERAVVGRRRSAVAQGALRARRLRAAGRGRAAGAGRQPARHRRRAATPTRSARTRCRSCSACCCWCWPCCSPSTCCAAGTARPRAARTST